MRNRAKCKKCNSIIESRHENDYVDCKCGAISVSGGDKMICAATAWNLFMRVDDEGNEIVPTVKDKSKKDVKEEALEALEEMIKRIEEMPPNAMVASINHYDYVSLLILISTLFRSGVDENSASS